VVSGLLPSSVTLHADALLLVFVDRGGIYSPASVPAGSARMTIIVTVVRHDMYQVTALLLSTHASGRTGAIADVPSARSHHQLVSADLLAAHIRLLGLRGMDTRMPQPQLCIGALEDRCRQLMALRSRLQPVASPSRASTRTTPPRPKSTPTPLRTLLPVSPPAQG
jgi:hypothetical protein